MLISAAPYEIVVFFIGDARRRGASAAGDVAAELRLVDLLHRSALAREGAAGLTLLTDRTTDTAALGAHIRVVRRDLADMPIMLGRLTAESEYVGASDLARPILLLDTDILINRPLAPVFADDFDVGVTLRRGKGMPINSGVRFINNRRPDVSRRFMQDLAALVAGRFIDDANWWADQLALNAMVPVDPSIAMPARIEHGGYRIQVLPVSEYNYSPPAYRWAMLPSYRSKYVLHFKSARRKRLMPVFFRRHFASA
jgi:hypothetical protein